MDEQAKKAALRKITYGLYIFSTAGEDGIAAGTINWLSQASFKPPLVMAGVKKDSGLFDRLNESGQFAVNILASDQKGMAAEFFGPSDVNGDEINGYAYEPGETGSPLLEGIRAWVECEEVDRVDEGDHAVIVGEVVAAGARDEGMEPLEMRDTDWVYGG